jgi:threonyl-tRNA synthetase
MNTLDKIKLFAALSKLTLEEFVNSPLSNAYIKYKTIDSYFRKGRVAVDGKIYNVLTRANTSNRKRMSNITIATKPKSTGLYRELDELTFKLAKQYGYDGVYVESVLNDFLGEKLEQYGYKQVNQSYGAANYFKHV